MGPILRSASLVRYHLDSAKRRRRNQNCVGQGGEGVSGGSAGVREWLFFVEKERCESTLDDRLQQICQKKTTVGGIPGISLVFGQFETVSGMNRDH